MVEVPNGAADIPRVVRALDEAGIGVGSLELVHPTLDDVFVAKTGKHIPVDSAAAEGAE
jgi:ABC-2 type transport system ATP-binding protein